MPAEKQVSILFAGINGYLDEWPAEAIGDYEKQMLEFMESKHRDLLDEIRDKNDISSELDGKLRKAMDQFKGVFQTSSK
jgi:F-type H+-transporting ATPase subunit alpha